MVSRLLSFSKKLAIYMYNQWLKSNNVFLPANQYQDFVRNSGLEADPYSYKERSLINRTSNGEIKFSHRSFWEFFVAIDSFEHLGKSYVKNGLEMAVRFHKEILELYNKKRFLACINYLDSQLFYKEDIIAERPEMSIIGEIQELISIQLKPKSTRNPYQVFHLIYELWAVLLRSYFSKYSVVYDYKTNKRSNKAIKEKDSKPKVSPDVIVDRLHLLLSRLQDFFEHPYHDHKIKGFIG